MLGTGFLSILGASVLFGALHSTLASNWMKRLSARAWPTFASKYYRLGYVVMASLTSLAFASTVVLLPDQRIYAIPFPFVLLTLAIQLAAILAAFLSMWQGGMMSFLGVDVLLNRKLTSPDETLKVDGFYKYMRHPIYSFSFLVMWLFPVMTWNLLAFFLGCTVYSLIGSYFEEKRLLVQFGESYKAYQAKTPAFIPNPFRK
jgi:protein-S-isoprenylcysteine O-methyltransferase Ste14